MSVGDYASLTTEELVRRFAETAKRTGCIFSRDNRRVLTPLHRMLVPEMQALGAELRKRKPVDRVRQLCEDDDPDVRGWAGPQFHAVDPEWADAAVNGLIYGWTTRQVIAWRQRIFRGAPKRPRLNEITVAQLVDRFVDACERCYGTTRFLSDAEGGGSNMKAYNKVSGDVYAAARELSRRGDLRALLPLFDHPLVTVRQQAAGYCLPIATERATATLEKVADSMDFSERMDASRTLGYWRKGQYCAFPDDLWNVRV